MKFRQWPKRDPNKNYFLVPNEVFHIGLSHSEISIYCYLLSIEDRETYQCWPSYKTIGKALGMSENTVRKYVAMLEARGLITTAYTTMRARDGRPMNGHLMYTICPFHEVVNDHYRVQMEALELQARQKSVAALASQKEVPAQ